MPIDLRAYIRNVPDFPQPGVLFRDITPLLLDPVAFRHAIDELTALIEPFAPEAIVAIESRGFLLGAPLALRLGLPLVPVRKAGKLPAERMSVEYALEYGRGQLDMHVDALAPGRRVTIVDDLLATGGTAVAAARLVEMAGARVSSFAFLVELEFLRGRASLPGHQVTSLVTYTGSA
jgi:adenine phosphoribosyltransferase